MLNSYVLLPGSQLQEPRPEACWGDPDVVVLVVIDVLGSFGTL